LVTEGIAEPSLSLARSRVATTSEEIPGNNAAQTLAKSVKSRMGVGG